MPRISEIAKNQIDVAIHSRLGGQHRTINLNQKDRARQRIRLKASPGQLRLFKLSFEEPQKASDAPSDPRGPLQKPFGCHRGASDSQQAVWEARRDLRGPLLRPIEASRDSLEVPKAPPKEAQNRQKPSHNRPGRHSGTDSFMLVSIFNKYCKTPAKTPFYNSSN